MKTLFSVTRLTFAISLIAIVLLPACSNSHAGPTETTSVLASPQQTIPFLKGRKQGLGTPEERAQVAGIYDTQKALLQKEPQNAKAWLKLAELFMNEARVTGEHPYYYPAALQMIDAIPNMASSSDEIRFEAGYLKASVLLSMHEFQKGLEVGEATLKIIPSNAGIHGILIDANVELGSYEKAVEWSDKMVSLRPDMRSYSRISYLREIHGDPKGAIEAMEMAVDAAMPGYEQSAWCRLNLGNLYERYGKLDEAKMHYTILLQERPDYPFAYSGLASIAMKKGDYKDAEAQLDKAIELIPEVAFYEQKVELFRLTKREAEAQKLVTEVIKMFGEDQASGHKVDLELAAAHLRLAHDMNAAKTSAEKAYIGRETNIDVNAMMAEVHYALGDLVKAQQYMDVAMRTHSLDPSKNILAGLIDFKLGNKAQGKDKIKQAFANDPYLRGDLAKEAKAML
jgi:tetratricopeptide (TPR) repeat protein